MISFQDRMLCCWYDLYSSLICWSRFKLAIRLPIDLTESLEREDLGKYMLVAVFPLLVLVTGHLVQMLWRSVRFFWNFICNLMLL